MTSINGQEQDKNLKQARESKNNSAIVLTMLGGTFQLVMMTSTTVGEQNKKIRFSRFLTWIELVVVLSAFMANIAAMVYRVCSNSSSWDYLFPWRLSVALLLNAYLAVVYLEIRYLSLFLPQAPFVAWKALLDVGFKGIGSAAIFMFAVILLFDQPWLHLHFACLLALLIAALLAVWVCLARIYGGAPVSA